MKQITESVVPTSGDIANLDIQFYLESKEGRIKLTRTDKSKPFVYAYYFPDVERTPNELFTFNTIINGVKLGTFSWRFNR